MFKRREALTIRRNKKDMNAKLAALLFGAFLMLIAVPAMGLYNQAVNGVKPIDYSLWVVLYFVYAMVVLVSGSRR